MVSFQENVLLAEFSNYKIGGPAKFYFEAKSEKEVKEAVSVAKENNLPIFILGGGTNILIDDKGFDGLVLKPNIKTFSADGEFVKAGAGVLMSELLDFTADKGLSGLEWAGGLPGTLGGAIRGNAGAFSGETKDSIESVESLTVGDLKQATRNKNECKFGYRTSIFKQECSSPSEVLSADKTWEGKEIILSAKLKLKRGDSKEIKEAIEEKINYRRERHPLEYPNIGSIFKNIDLRLIPEDLKPKVASVVKADPFPVVPTAYLISEAGLKGTSRGGAMISPKHPNFIVNMGNASSNDVKELIKLAKTEVKNKFGIDLEEEVIIL